VATEWSVGSRTTFPHDHVHRGRGLQPQDRMTTTSASARAPRLVVFHELWPRSATACWALRGGPTWRSLSPRRAFCARGPAPAAGAVAHPTRQHAARRGSSPAPAARGAARLLARARQHAARPRQGPRLLARSARLLARSARLLARLRHLRLRGSPVPWLAWLLARGCVDPLRPGLRGCSALACVDPLRPTRTARPLPLPLAACTGSDG
jgi:hypothetical protein